MTAKFVNQEALFLIKCKGPVAIDVLCELYISLGIFHELQFLCFDIHKVKSLDTWEHINWRLVSHIPSYFFVVPWEEREFRVSSWGRRNSDCFGAAIFICRCLFTINIRKRVITFSSALPRLKLSSRSNLEIDIGFAHLLWIRSQNFILSLWVQWTCSQMDLSFFSSRPLWLCGVFSLSSKVEVLSLLHLSLSRYLTCFDFGLIRANEILRWVAHWIRRWRLFNIWWIYWRCFYLLLLVDLRTEKFGVMVIFLP
jgi:hypothetical protein